MLAGLERRWWPWAPLLLLQGAWVRLATPRLQAVAPRAGSCGSGERSLRIVGVGDSIIAGIGVERAEQSLVAQVAAGLATRTGATVNWQACGFPGIDSRTMLEKLVPPAARQPANLVLLSCGVNDAVAGRAPAAFRDNLRRSVEALTSRVAAPAVVYAGMPPMASFPALPAPLSRLLGERALALKQQTIALTGYRGMRVVVFPERLQAETFSRDGFHPGVAGCAAWAEWVLDGLSQQIEDWRR